MRSQEKRVLLTSPLTQLGHRASLSRLDRGNLAGTPCARKDNGLLARLWGFCWPYVDLGLVLLLRDPHRVSQQRLTHTPFPLWNNSLQP